MPARKYTCSVQLGKNLFHCFQAECAAQGNVLDLWADELGAKLQADGASIPHYRQKKGTEEQPEVFQAEDRWELLAEEPLLELQLLALRPAAPPPEFDPREAKSPSRLLDERIRTF